MVHENGQELKRPAFQEKWLNRNDLYDVDITLNCSDDNLSFYDTDDENLPDDDTDDIKEEDNITNAMSMFAGARKAIADRA